MKLINKIWPWSRIYKLQARVIKLEHDLRAERDSHEKTKDVVQLHKEAAAKNDTHMRKMANIIALRGGYLG